MYEYIKNYTYENLDVLIGAPRFAGFLQDCGGIIENLYLKNIRHEKTTGGPAFLASYNSFRPDRHALGYGQIRNIYLSDIKDYTGMGVQMKGVVQNGVTHYISNVTFDNYFNGSTLLTDIGQIDATHTQNIRFTTHKPIFVNIDAKELYARDSKPAVFIISRTGPLNEPRTVEYTIRGTGRNGIDYEQIPANITIPSGSDRAQIKIIPKAGRVKKEVHTVMLSLENERLNPAWSLGPNYHAVIVLQ